MNQQTIYFLQALWDMGVQKDKLRALTRNASQSEIDRLLKGVLDPQTVWVSEEAKQIKKRIAGIRNEITKVNYPGQVTGISREYRKLIGKMQALQINTAKTLLSDAGPVFRDVHVIVKQLVPYALKKMKRQTCYQLYRLLVLNGKFPAATLFFPTSDLLEEWVYFYQNKLQPLFEQLDDRTLDGRWAYERKRVVLNGMVQIEQYVSVKPKQEELEMAPGMADMGPGEEGKVRIYGRGCLTNISPWDLKNGMEMSYEKKRPTIQDFSFVSGEDVHPGRLLDVVFGDRKYLISPDVYFEFVNRCIVARTFYYRIRQGECLQCGSPLYHGKCPNCEK